MRKKISNATSLKVAALSRDAQFGAYEKLPKIIREFLQQQVVDWSAKEFLSAWRMWRGDEKSFLRAYEAAFKKRYSAESKEFYGPDHPNA